MSQTRFVPSQHGLTFRNWFRAAGIGYGLCGGMCFTALDAFHARESPPPAGTPGLLRRLWRRQLASLALRAERTTAVWLRCLAWQLGSDRVAASDTRHPAQRTRAAWQKLRPALDAGQPTVLCLIRAWPWGSPWINHQVVATGYSLSQDDVTLTLYDPNVPGEDAVTLQFTQAGPWRAHQTHTRHVPRAFFIVPYRPSSGGRTITGRTASLGVDSR